MGARAKPARPDGRRRKRGLGSASYVNPRLLVGAWTLALAAAAGSLALVLTSNHEDSPAGRAALIVVLGLVFVGSGLIALVRRPDNRIGALMAVVGFLWFLSALAEANNASVFTLGVALMFLVYPAFAHLFLAYPSGRLESKLARAVVLAAYVDVTVVQLLLLFFMKHPGGPANLGCDDCPRNVLLLHDSHSTSEVVAYAQRSTGIALIALALYLLARRVWTATPALRRMLLPVFVTATASILLLGAQLIVVPLSETVARTLNWFVLASLATVPIGFLLGLLQTSLARGAGVDAIFREIPERASPEEVQAGLRGALRDPTLEVAYWYPEEGNYVDVHGNRLELPEETPTRAVTRLDYADSRVGALVHDAALREEPNVLQAIAGAARIALERDQLLVKDRARAERYRALLRAMPDLMFRISRDGRYLGYNAPEERDLLRPDVVGLTVWERLPHDLADRIMAAAERAFAGEGPQALEYELDLRGDLRSYEGRVAAAGDQEFLLIVRDITERKRQQQELEESRARIVEAQDDARRRLERNLHDGAQQRLVALSISLRLAQQHLRAKPDAAEELLEASREELAQALEELRELARGIHPAVLTDRGLPEALEALAARTPLPIELHAPDERLPGPVEAAAYYVVSEALANVTKYADASSVYVRIGQMNGSAYVEVADDGVGGADPQRGSGLRGLADRLAALNGTLSVESPEGGGTCVRAEIPLGVRLE
jgi:PAS domain S-box-containing protein